MNKISVREISRKTGFSPATVSKSLNHRAGVSQQTADIIIQAARDLGYQRTEHLDQVRFVVARKNGAIIDESTFHPAVIEGVEKQARQFGLQTTFVHLDIAAGAAYRKRVDELCSDASGAILLLGTELGEDDFDDFSEAENRLVLLDSWSDRHYFNAVTIANEDSAFRAVSYLVSRGHRTIGYLAGDFRIQNFKYREAGYRRALEAAGITFDPARCVTLGTTLERAHADMCTWLGNHPSTEMPTAYFADNDVLAVGALRAFNEAGYSIPDDVSIIGFDDLAFSSFSNPPLTTIHVPKQEIGQLAVRMLMESMTDPQHYTRKVQVSTNFVERASVRSYM